MKPFPVILEKSRGKILEKAIPFPFWECSSHVCLYPYIYCYHSTHQYLTTAPQVFSDSRKTSTSSSFAHTVLNPGTSELFWAMYLFTLISVSSPLSPHRPSLAIFSIFTFSHPASFLSLFSQVRQTVKTKEILFLEGEKMLTFYVHAQLCPTLCNPMDFNSLGSSVHRILQARILEWVTISYSRGSSPPRDWTHVSCIGWWILLHWDSWGGPNFLCRTY